MGCIAQVLQDPVIVDVTAPSNTDCCCANIITAVDDIDVSMKQINVTILRGKVVCESDGDAPVEGAIVVATDGADNHFVGITNSDGKYSICVPIPEVGIVISYTVQAYCCCSCNDDVCEDAECNCGCNGD